MSVLHGEPRGFEENAPGDSWVVAPNPAGSMLHVTPGSIGLNEEDEEEIVDTIVHGPADTDFEAGWTKSEHPLATIAAPVTRVSTDDHLNDRHIQYSPDPCEWVLSNAEFDEFGRPHVRFWSADNSGVGEMAQDWNEASPTPPIALPTTELVLPAGFPSDQAYETLTLQPLGAGFYAVIAYVDNPDGPKAEGGITVYVTELVAGELVVRSTINGVTPGSSSVLNERSAVLYFWSPDGNEFADISLHDTFQRIDLRAEEGATPSASVEALDVGIEPLAEGELAHEAALPHRAYRSGDELIVIEVKHTHGFIDPPASVDDPVEERDGFLRIRRVGTVPHATLVHVTTSLYGASAVSIEGLTNHHTGGAHYLADAFVFGFGVTKDLETDDPSYYRTVIVDTGGGIAFLRYPFLVPLASDVVSETWGLEGLDSSDVPPAPYAYIDHEVWDDVDNQFVTATFRLPYPFAYDVILNDSDPYQRQTSIAEISRSGAIYLVGKWVAYGRIANPTNLTGPWRSFEGPFVSTCGQYLTPPYVLGAGLIRSPEFVFSTVGENVQSGPGHSSTVFLG